jgi:hypothetical protein
MKKLLFFIAIPSLLLISCSKDKQDGDIQIRVENQTGQRLDEVSIFSFSPDMQKDAEIKYGSVLPGSTTTYQHHDRAYGIPLFKSIMEGYGLFEIANIPCLTGVGELGEGKYVLIVKSENNYPIAYFAKD